MPGRTLHDNIPLGDLGALYGASNGRVMQITPQEIEKIKQQQGSIVMEEDTDYKPDPALETRKLLELKEALQFAHRAASVLKDQGMLPNDPGQQEQNSVYAMAVVLESKPAYREIREDNRMFFQTALNVWHPQSELLFERMMFMIDLRMRMFKPNSTLTNEQAIEFIKQMCDSGSAAATRQ